MRTSFKRKNKHGRVGVKKPLGSPTKEDQLAASYEKGWKAGMNAGLNSVWKDGEDFMRSLLKERKATEIHRKIKQRLSGTT